MIRACSFSTSNYPIFVFDEQKIELVRDASDWALKCNSFDDLQIVSKLSTHMKSDYLMITCHHCQRGIFPTLDANLFLSEQPIR